MDFHRVSKRKASNKATQALAEIYAPKRARYTAPLADSEVINVDTAAVSILASVQVSDASSLGEESKENLSGVEPSVITPTPTLPAAAPENPATKDGPAFNLRTRLPKEAPSKLTKAKTTSRKSAPKKSERLEKPVYTPRFVRKVALGKCFVGPAPVHITRKRAKRMAKTYGA